jgi:hypothetical protein
MGGYWGRESFSTGVHDDLLVSCLALEQTESRATTVVFIISLDLVGVSFTTSETIAEVVGTATGLSGASVFLSCTHTHTGPQTHTSFIGMGHADEKSYMQHILHVAVAAAAKGAMANLTAVTVSCSRCEGIQGLSINRRERSNADGGATAAHDGPEPKWFEKLGGTKLGKRPDGPCTSHAHVVTFRSEAKVGVQDGEEGAVLSGEGKVVSTLLHFSCHPTSIGMDTLQSADYCGEARRVVEAHTGAPALFLQGCCGDVNPVHHRGGYEAAGEMGQALGRALCAAIERDALRLQLEREEGGEQDVVQLTSHKERVMLPLQPLPDDDEARTFVAEQEEWLRQVEEEQEHLQRTTSKGRKATKEDAAQAMTMACKAPTACCAYARKLASTVTCTQAPDGGGASSLPFGVHCVRIGPVALVGFEGEMFVEYQQSLERSSPFPDGHTLVCGYVGGCVGYIPTAAEFKHGGYEVLHAYRVYGQYSMITEESEALILRSAHAGLALISNDNVLAPYVPEPDDWLRTPPAHHTGWRPRLYAEAVRSNFPPAHDTYNAIGWVDGGTKDGAGHAYYCLSSEEPKEGAQLLRCSFCGPVEGGKKKKKGGKGARSVGKPLDLPQVQVQLERPPMQVEVLAADLSDVCGDVDLPVPGMPVPIAQGKIHVPFFEEEIDTDGRDKRVRIYTASHVGFYTMVDGMETLPKDHLPDGSAAYPGGCFFSFIPDEAPLESPFPLSTAAPAAPPPSSPPPSPSRFEVLGRVPDGEGVITMAMDVPRRRIFGLLWPSGLFVVLPIGPEDGFARKMSLFDYPGRGYGESVHPRTGSYRCICRSVAVDARTGCAYFTNTEGDVLEWAPPEWAGPPSADDTIEMETPAPPSSPWSPQKSPMPPSRSNGRVAVILHGYAGLRRQYCGDFDPKAPGSMGYQWRQVFWHERYKGGCILGVHGNSGYLFEFFPPKRVVTMNTQRGEGEGHAHTVTVTVAAARLQMLERLTSAPSRAFGMGDQFSYGYLGLAVGPAVAGLDHLIFYLTGGPIVTTAHTDLLANAAAAAAETGPEGASGAVGAAPAITEGFDGPLTTSRREGVAYTPKGEAKGAEDLHLVTIDLSTPVPTPTDHGAIFYVDRPGWPSYVNSIAVGTDGFVYALGRQPDDGMTDLFRVPIPPHLLKKRSARRR